MRVGQRVRNGPVLFDRPVEHDALACVANRAVDRSPADTHRFGRDHDALGVEPVEQALKAAPHLAHHVCVADDEVALNTSFELTALRPSLGISRMSQHSRSKSVVVEGRREALGFDADPLDVVGGGEVRGIRAIWKCPRALRQVLPFSRR